MASRKGSENKAKSTVRELVQKNTDFPGLIKELCVRAMEDDTQAARLLFEYGFGKAPQPLEHSGTVQFSGVEITIKK